MDNLPKEVLQKMRNNQEQSRQENRIKEIKSALIIIGFEEDGRYFRKNGDSIKVYDDDTLDKIFERLIKFSATQKIWEIKRVLDVV
jgi:hypothetical protein